MRSVRTSLALGAVVLGGALVGPAGTGSAAPAGVQSASVDGCLVDSCAAQRVARAAETSILDTIGITRVGTRAKSQIRGGYSFKGDLMPESKSVTEGPTDTEDDVPLRMPDTTGNVANFAAFKGQTLDLPAGQQRQYTKLHFFGTTADGAGGGEFTLEYTSGADQKVTVAFADWCQSAGPGSHIAIGPIPGRYTLDGEDGAPCSIFHVVGNADPARTLKSVTLPSGTSGGGNRVAYLMALTLEGAESSFTMPYLDGVNPFPDDGVAPTTSGALAGTPDANGWHRTPPTLTVSADDGDGSGVERIQYRVNGGPGRTYTAPVAITDEGDLNIEYRAYDRAGNPSGFKSIRAKVDATAPTTSAATYPLASAGGFTDREVKVTLGAQDGSGSGVTRTEYRVGDAPATPYSGTFAVGGSGTQVVQYRSVDTAGNEEPWKSLSIRVDTVAPTTTLLLNGAAPAAEYVNAARVAFTRTDGEDGSGAVSTEYRVDGGAWTPYQGGFDLSGRQVYQLDFRSTDQVGNVENYRSVRFTVRAPAVLEAPRQQAPATPAPRPFAAIEDVSSRVRTLTALRGGRFRVNVSCQGVRRGKLTATVTRAVARKLKLKSGTLASKRLDCGEQGRATVSLRPSSSIRTRLARTKGSVRVKLTLRMTGAPADTQTVTLKGKS